MHFYFAVCVRHLYLKYNKLNGQTLFCHLGKIIKIGWAFSEEFDDKNCDKRILYIREDTIADFFWVVDKHRRKSTQPSAFVK